MVKLIEHGNYKFQDSNGDGWITLNDPSSGDKVFDVQSGVELSISQIQQRDPSLLEPKIIAKNEDEAKTLLAKVSPEVSMAFAPGFVRINPMTTQTNGLRLSPNGGAGIVGALAVIGALAFLWFSKPGEVDQELSLYSLSDFWVGDFPPSLDDEFIIDPNENEESGDQSELFVHPKIMTKEDSSEKDVPDEGGGPEKGISNDSQVVEKSESGNDGLGYSVADLPAKLGNVIIDFLEGRKTKSQAYREIYAFRKVSPFLVSKAHARLDGWSKAIRYSKAWPDKDLKYLVGRAKELINKRKSALAKISGYGNDCMPWKEAGPHAILLAKELRNRASLVEDIEQREVIIDLVNQVLEIDKKFIGVKLEYKKPPSATDKPTKTKDNTKSIFERVEARLKR